MALIDDLEKYRPKARKSQAASLVPHSDKTTTVTEHSVEHDVPKQPTPPKDKQADKAKTPLDLRIPAFLMNFPFTISTENPNNAWMTEMSAEQLEINRELAFAQWMQLANFIGANSWCSILPSGGEFQDLVYVANMGMVLPHLDKATVILSNFTSPPRQGEEHIGKAWFEIWNKLSDKKYEIVMCPHKWEGEAEIKWLNGNHFVGGYGIRSTPEAYDWMAEKFGMDIIKVRMKDEKLYHLDGIIFQLTGEKVILCTEVLEPQEVKRIEKYSEIIPVNQDMARRGVTSNVRINNMVLHASELMRMKESDKEYDETKATVDKLTKICIDNALEPVFFNLSELEKSGACLCCCCMHLNWVDAKKKLF